MRYHCHFCQKSVTSDLPNEAVIRATLICPECLELADQVKLNDVMEDLEKKIEKETRE